MKILNNTNSFLLIAIAVVITIVNWQEEALQSERPGNVVAGKVTHVRDGDTIEVRGVPIRLNGLNCDERGTPLGDAATAAIRELITGDVTCRLNGDKTYDREVGRCSLADGRDIGAELIRGGLCGRCDRYDPQGAYVAVQREAGRFRGNFPDYCVPR